MQALTRALCLLTHALRRPHPHGFAPACAHLGSLCVEPGVQDLLSGSRDCVVSDLDLPQVGQGELHLPQCLTDSLDGIRF